MILDQILEFKRTEIKELKERVSLVEIEKKARELKAPKRSLQNVLSVKSNRPHLICELKKASPSGGVLRANFDPLGLARIFEEEKASGISVLTERNFFQGNPDTPKSIRPITTLPLLRKDFIVDVYQIFETALLLADTYLLIVSILSNQDLKLFLSIGRSLGMEPIVEVHTDEELDRAIQAGALMIGVNSRNLKSLTIDREIPAHMLKRIPSGVIAIVESGIASRTDIEYYKSYGANCFLIGTVLMKAPDVRSKIRELMEF